MFLKQKIKQYLIKKLGVREIPSSLERLANLGFQPKQIFDVGAYKGDFTELCLKCFPHKRSVEPRALVAIALKDD